LDGCHAGDSGSDVHGDRASRGHELRFHCDPDKRRGGWTRFERIDGRHIGQRGGSVGTDITRDWSDDVRQFVLFVDRAILRGLWVNLSAPISGFWADSLDGRGQQPDDDIVRHRRSRGSYHL
jgi:hypothetical protein